MGPWGDSAGVRFLLKGEEMRNCRHCGYVSAAFDQDADGDLICPNCGWSVDAAAKLSKSMERPPKSKLGFWDSARLALKITTGDPAKEWQKWVDSMKGQDALVNGAMAISLMENVETIINAVDVANLLLAAATVCRKKAAGFRYPGSMKNWVAGVNDAAWTRQAEIIERAVKALEKEALA